ncbi:MAG: formylglycine-generating enzyme family protein [Candidatus Stygibacter frigidus]|nr:formylglycine-generating enzyme family protein [Candidatus Stygibacter frigidus]
MKRIGLLIFIAISCVIWANTLPELSNQSFSQRTDGSMLIDVYYDVFDADGDTLTISMAVSADAGETWVVSCDSLSGDIGEGILSGTGKHVIWNFGAECPGIFSELYCVRILVDDEQPEGMIFVEGGTFNNGTSDVTVSSFHIGQYEVTQSEYEAVMGNNPSSFTSVTNGPVEQVSWFNAIEYCNRRSMYEGITPCYSYSTYGTNPDDWPAGWNSSYQNHTNVSCDWTANCYRLPTEAEWHFAALGGNETNNYTYSGSNNIDEVAWYSSNSGNTTHTVGTKAANELGTFDMSGNVWEWVWDIYGSYPGGSQTNPHGVVSGSFRVVRGGSWYDYANFCPVSGRFNIYAAYSNYDLGFRLCRVSP